MSFTPCKRCGGSGWFDNEPCCDWGGEYFCDDCGEPLEDDDVELCEEEHTCMDCFNEMARDQQDEDELNDSAFRTP